MKKAKPFFDQHFHGAFGVNFNTCDEQEVIMLCKKLVSHGIVYCIPTLVTDRLENLKRQIEIIKNAAKNNKNGAKIVGIHLEGPFINSKKKGIHFEEDILPLQIDFFKQIEDDFIKIVTIANELDKNFEFSEYLKQKGIKVQLGHSVSLDLSYADGLTHTFNAMEEVSHKKDTLPTLGILNDSVFCEIIADGVHVKESALRLFFKAKNKNKVILVSDCLPLAHSNLKHGIFSNVEIFNNKGRLEDANGTLAGSSNLLDEIFRFVVKKNILSFEEAIKISTENVYEYHGIDPVEEILFDDELNVVKVVGI